MKTGGRLSRSPLKGTFGDAIFAVLCGCGYNVRKILADVRALLTFILAALGAAVRPGIWLLNAYRSDETRCSA